MSVLVTKNGNSTKSRGAVGRSIGFPASPATSEPSRQPHSTTRPSAPHRAGSTLPSHQPPTAKRAKGRWFISFVLFTMLGTIAYLLWEEFVRYRAYGVIEGRLLQCASPWPGFVDQLHVEDGQKVVEGELLATLSHPELQLQLAKLESDILLAQASLGTRLAELKVKGRETALETLRSQVDHVQMLSQLHSERSRLSELEMTSEAISKLGDSGTVSKIDADQTRVAMKNQHSRVQTLEEAARQLQEGLAKLEASPSEQQLLESERLRLESLTVEWKKIHGLLKQGQVRSPVSGKIISSQRKRGEFVPSNTLLFEILEDHSLFAVVYVPQSEAQRFKPRDSLRLNVPPFTDSIPFEIERLDDQLAPAPSSLSRFYRRDQRLVAIIARPSTTGPEGWTDFDSAWLGAEVRLPRWSQLNHWPQIPIQIPTMSGRKEIPPSEDRGSEASSGALGLAGRN